MARARDPNRDKAHDIYKANPGIELIEIASQLNVPVATVRSWKSRDDWECNATQRNATMQRNVKPIDDGTKETMLNENLTHEQRLFCIYYSKSFNAAQSYQKAYQCTYDNACSHAWELWKNEEVKKEVNRLNQLKAEQISIGEKDLLELHMRIAFADMGDYASFGMKEVQTEVGSINMSSVDLKDSANVDTQLIKEVKQGKDGISIKLLDRCTSMDWLDRYFLLNPLDRHKVEYDNAKLELERKKMEPDNPSDGVKYTGIPSTMVAPAFAPVVFDIESRLHQEYVFPGGRGSTKSSFISEEVIDLIMKNDGIHALVVRQVADTLRTSVYAQVIWAINALGLEDEFHATVSPLEITRKSTSQKIYFRGADDPGKIKSIKVQFGYIGVLWLEELDQFAGEEAVRKIEQSVIRGGELAYVFKSFNPPKTANNWANKYIKMPKANRLVTHSTYKDVPPQWLGKPFLDEAEFLRESNPIAYENEYMGIANGTGGNVFDNVKIEAITDEQIKQFDRLYNGLDWGWYPDPFHFGRMHYDAARMRLFIFMEYRCNKQSNRQTADKLIELGITANDLITCDSAEPKSVGDYRSYGLLARGADKGPGSVDYSMKWLQSLTEIIIDNSRCPETANEFLNYEYERDKEGNVISGYPDKDNHGIDMVRYGTNSIWKKRGQ